MPGMSPEILERGAESIAKITAIPAQISSGVGQMHPVARLHKPINKPVPVVSRFHHQAMDRSVMRG